jgi:Ser/Thr protein kinase RdoA (MazF antagonist)
MTASNHRIHGWSGDEIARRNPPLDTANVQALLAGFAPLRGPARILWHSPRPFSAAARVRTPAGEVFVKRQHVRVRTPQALAEEHAFIAHLRDGGLPVPQILANDHGDTAIQCGDWVYEVHAPAVGIDLYRDVPSWTPLLRLDHARSAGRMLARLHRTAAGFAAPTRSAPLLVARDDVLRASDFFDAIEARCARRPALAGYLAKRDWRGEASALAARHRRVQPQLASLPRLWTHGDWHVSNLFWSSADDDAGAASVLDFGLCAPTFALYDLATAIERNAVAWLQLEQGMRAVFPETAQALIAGYAEVLPLAAAQRALLAELLPLVHVDFALSEMDYFLGVLGAEEQADIGWRDFLLGHEAWFDTAAGRALLDAIRAAA